MYHIKKLKSKDLKVLLQYNLGSEKFKGIPKKVKLVEAVNDFFRNDWKGIV